MHPKLDSAMSSSIPSSWTRPVLVVRIARNHPLPDGNKRLAWQALTMFCALNGHQLKVPLDEAVSTMLAIAAGELDQATVADWLTGQLDTNAL